MKSFIILTRFFLELLDQLGLAARELTSVGNGLASRFGLSVPPPTENHKPFRTSICFVR